MLKQFAKKLAIQFNDEANHPQVPPTTQTPLHKSLDENLKIIKQRYHQSSDLIIKEIEMGEVKVALISIEALINFQLISNNYLEPLLQYEPLKNDPKEVFDYMTDQIPIGINLQEMKTFEDVFQFMMSGFSITLVDGMPHGFGFSAAGFNFRSVSEPATELNMRGGREGFTEVIRINLSMVRRRLKSPNLKFELLQVGNKSKTDVCLLYLTDMADEKLIAHIKETLNKIKLDVILDSGYIQPFLEGKPFSIFSDIGTTERPDTMVAKLSEGRIGILVDGTPYALITPYFFVDNFMNFDDYCTKSYFVGYTRILKYISFLTTIFLPGLYVGIGTHHPELFPHALLYTIMTAELTSTFPLFYQAIILGVFFEILREASLRLPKPAGAAIGIVGGLVIGDAVVSAGLVGSPMILIIGLTAITSFVIPSLQEPITILRFCFIFLGGFFGLYGISLGICILMLNICSLENVTYTYLEPLVPLKMKHLNDAITRISWRHLNHPMHPISSDDSDQKD